MTEGMVFLSILVTNIAAAEIAEQGTEVVNFSNLNCSIVEVVDMEDNTVEVVVESSDMMVGLNVSKEAS